MTIEEVLAEAQQQHRHWMRGETPPDFLAAALRAHFASEEVRTGLWDAVAAALAQREEGDAASVEVVLVLEAALSALGLTEEP